MLDALQRRGERLAGVERALGEASPGLMHELAQIRRDLVEVKSGIASLDSKVTSGHAEILTILHRLETAACPKK